jgi:hypothetical protein
VPRDALGTLLDGKAGLLSEATPPTPLGPPWPTTGRGW